MTTRNLWQHDLGKFYHVDKFIYKKCHNIWRTGETIIVGKAQTKKAMTTRKNFVRAFVALKSMFRVIRSISTAVQC